MATRIYLPNTGTAPITNATLGSWTETTGFDRVAAVTSRISSVMTSKVQAHAATAANSTFLSRQYVIGPLAGQTFAATTVKGTIRVLESAANDNLDAMRMSVRVCAPDGTTFRTAIWPVANSTVAEFNTALRAKRLATGGTTTSSVITEGDYLIIEIGTTSTVGGTSLSDTISYGDDNATDLGDNETDLTALNPFIEFAANMKFLKFGLSQAQAKINAFGTTQFAQAQAKITTTRIYAQAQADIKVTSNTFAQAQTDIKVTTNIFAQAQAQLISFGVNKFAQSQADILVTYQAYTQAQAQIIFKQSAKAQASALIQGTYFLPFTDTFTRTVVDGLGTSDNGDVWSFKGGTAANADVNGTQATLITQSGGVAQHWRLINTLIIARGLEFSGTVSVDKLPASGLIDANFGLPQINPTNATTLKEGVGFNIFSGSGNFAVIEEIDGSGSGQSTPFVANDTFNFKVQIVTVSGGNVRSRSKIWNNSNPEPEFGTAVDNPHQLTSFGHIILSIGAASQANAPFTWTFSSLHIEEAWITQHAQAQAQIILIQKGFAQAQSDIKTTYNVFAQSQANILQTYRGYGQANTSIKQTYNAFSQAQASIKAVSNSFAQSMARIGITTYEYHLRKIAGLQSFWTLGEPSTKTTIDDYFGAINGAVNGTPTFSQAPVNPLQLEPGIKLNSNTDYLTFGDNYDFAGSYSIIGWAYQTSQSGTQRLISKQSGNTTGFAVQTIGNFRFRINNGDAVVNISTPTNTWFFFAFSYETGSQIFKAVLNNDFSNGTTSLTPTDVANEFTIGRNAYDTNGRFIGNIGSIAVLNSAVSFDDFQALYTIAKSGAIVRPGQAQAQIKQTYRGYAQAQADILTTSTKFAQAQATIQGRTFGQAAGLIAGTYFIPFLDTFTRSVTDALGTSDNGGTWTLTQGTAANTDVNGSNATIISETSLSQIWDLKSTLISPQNGAGYEFSGIVSVDKLTVTGSLLVQLGLKNILTSQITGATFTFSAGTGTINMSADEAANSVGTGAGLAYNAGDSYNIKVQILPSSGSQLYANIKRWKVGDPEPGWANRAVLATAPINRTYPRIRISAINDANSPYTVTIDNFQIIEAWQTQYSQAQAKIKQTYNSFAQAQADIKATYQVYAHAQADIKQTYDSFAQAQSDIKRIYTTYSQSQADILAVSRGYAQSMARIGPTTYERILRGISGLQSFWTLGEPSGASSIADYKGAINGTVNGIPTFSQASVNPQQLEPGIQFSASSQYLTFGDNYDITGTQSILIWFKHVGAWTAGNEFLISKQSSNTVGFAIGGNSSTGFYARIQSAFVSEGEALSADTWEFGVLVGESTTDYRLYLDNIKNDSLASVSTPTNVANNFTIGRDAHDSGGQFNGTIGSVAVFNTAVSFDDFQALYTVAKSGAIARPAQAQAKIKVIEIESVAQAQADILTTYQSFAQSQAQIILKQKGYSQTAALVAGTYFLPFLDTFTRTVSDSLGVSDNGDTWVLRTGTASNADVDGSVATLVTAGNAVVQTWDLNQTLANFDQGLEISFKAKIDKLPVGAGTITLAVGLSTVPDSVSQNASVGIRIDSATASNFVTVDGQGSIFAGPSATAGVYYRLKTQLIKTGIRTHYRAKIWLDGDPEPGWINLVNSTANSLSQQHIRLIVTGLTDANSPFTWTVDDINIVEAWLTIYGQAQATIKQTYNSFAQAQADILATSKSFAQSQVDIKVTSNAFAQAQADIKQTYQAYGQAQARILQVYNKCAQAQAQIKQTYQWYAQTQGTILTSYQGYAQAQADIRQTYLVFAQAQARILATSNSCGQTQADIKQTYQSYGQAQADIKTPYQGYGQSQADIKQVYCGFAQAQACIVGNGFAQAQAFIQSYLFGFAQAQAEIAAQIKSACAQAQGTIKTVVASCAQAQSDIKIITNTFAQSQAEIKTTYIVCGQSQADIKHTSQGYSQAQSDIKATTNNWGQANADIRSTTSHCAQTQGSIKQIYLVFAQAQGYIKRIEQGYAQAQAWIEITSSKFGQAQGTILSTTNHCAQVNAHIKQIYQKYGQSQAQIKHTYQNYAQAQGYVQTLHLVYAQAKALILAKITVVGQAQSRIILVGNAYGQAQAHVLAGVVFAQAQGYVRITHFLKSLYVSDRDSTREVGADIGIPNLTISDRASMNLILSNRIRPTEDTGQQQIHLTLLDRNYE